MLIFCLRNLLIIIDVQNDCVEYFRGNHVTFFFFLMYRKLKKCI